MLTCFVFDHQEPPVRCVHRKVNISCQLLCFFFIFYGFFQVSNCPEKENSNNEQVDQYHLNKTFFYECQRKRQETLINEKIRALPKTTRELTLNAIKKDLDGLNIIMN